jgi:protein-S-isoprenylcysteine O-methyltransferase Ste14
MRHPQYLAFILITFGMTLIVFQTEPVVEFNPFHLGGYSVIFYIWIGEVLAYIILGKIEDIALKAKYGDEFIEYKNTVYFMFPTIKLKKKDLKSGNEK